MAYPMSAMCIVSGLIFFSLLKSALKYVTKSRFENPASNLAFYCTVCHNIVLTWLFWFLLSWFEGLLCTVFEVLPK